MSETLRILAVDDEEGMRLGMQRILSAYRLDLVEFEQELEFSVDIAASGEEALQLLAAQTYDLLLLDHKMTGISGLEVLAQLGGEPRTLLTIMVTAYASLETAVEAIKRGAFDFLAKPFTPDELRAVVRKATTHLMSARQARKLAEERRRVRFEFISVLAHELKAPLGAIEGYLEILRDGTAGDDPAMTQKMIERSLDRLQGMRKLIFDLLDLTRIESGAKQRELAEHDLCAVAARALETVLPQAQARGIALDLDAAAPVLCTCDLSEIEMLLNNLVSNAVKYNRDGGKVTVRLQRADGLVCIEVSDTGIGLTAEEQAKLFQDFVRIKNEHTRGISGTGLGLSTVKKICRLYGGGVALASTPGQGSTFTVTLQAGG